jgi:hypothetical protein
MDPEKRLIIGFRKASISSTEVTTSKLILVKISCKNEHVWKKNSRKHKCEFFFVRSRNFTLKMDKWGVRDSNPDPCI